MNQNTEYLIVKVLSNSNNVQCFQLILVTLVIKTYSKPNLNIRLSVYPKYLMIPSTDLSKNFHSSFFSLSPLPVKFWWGLVENCKFFISKFTIFKRVFQNLKIFQKKSEIWVRKTGGVFRGQIWKNALFWKSRFFQFFLS